MIGASSGFNQEVLTPGRASAILPACGSTSHCHSTQYTPQFYLVGKQLTGGEPLPNL